MDIEVHISFDVNSIFVQAGTLNKKYANLITLEKAFNRIVAIGETEQEIAARDPAGWERIKGALAFEPIFDPKSFDPESMYWATRMLASSVHHEMRGVNLLDKLSCSLNIPLYELFPTNAQKHFEMRLERWPKLRILSVNGATVIAKGWKYHFAKSALDWGWRILIGLFVLVFVLRPDVFFAILTPLFEKISFGVIFLFVFLGLGLLWTTEMIWMIVMPAILPKQTLHRIFIMYQLQFVREKKTSVSKILADWFLGKDE